MNKSRESLKEAFQDEEYRYAYAEDFLNTWVATQIVTLREQRRLSQSEFGKLIGTKQPGVSRLENVNHSTWKTETLKRIARALGVRLKISFETFGSLLDEDTGFSRSFLMRPEFDNDPGLVERKHPESAIASTPVLSDPPAATELGRYRTKNFPTVDNIFVLPARHDASVVRYAGQ
jgi:transcriptional regulator with XRE-family HTH domain